MWSRSGTKLDGVPLVSSYLGYPGYRVIWGTLGTELFKVGGVPWVLNYLGYPRYRVI